MAPPWLFTFLDNVALTSSHIANHAEPAAVAAGLLCLVARAEQFDLEQPERLLKLLASMARNRIVDHVRSRKTARRDPGCPVAGSDALHQAEDRTTPAGSPPAGSCCTRSSRRWTPTSRRYWSGGCKARSGRRSPPRWAGLPRALARGWSGRCGGSPGQWS
jgi:hypothetical protein